MERNNDSAELKPLCTLKFVLTDVSQILCIERSIWPFPSLRYSKLSKVAFMDSLGKAGHLYAFTVQVLWYSSHCPRTDLPFKAQQEDTMGHSTGQKVVNSGGSTAY